MDGIELTLNLLGHALYTKWLFSKMRHCLQLSSQHIFMSILHQLMGLLFCFLLNHHINSFSVQVSYLQIKGGYTIHKVMQNIVKSNMTLYTNN
jgi:hypothetical protein